jgi:hypothetical protein
MRLISGKWVMKYDDCCAAGLLRIIQGECQRIFNSLAVLTNLEIDCASRQMAFATPERAY